MIDTHSHIYGPEYADDRDQVFQRASDCGVTHSILANVDTGTISDMIQCHAKYTDTTSMAMGLHPTSVNADYKQNLHTIEKTLSDNDFVAIGEIGMDLYWDNSFESEQSDALAVQTDWALQLDLPLILHIRKAYAETFKVLQRFKGHELRGVFHCFSGGIEEARKAVSLGFALGVGGVVTYKGSGLADILQHVGLQHVLLETDAPYLSPVPNRGKRNEPANLIYVCRQLATVFNTKPEYIDKITTENAKKIFTLL